MSLENDYPRHDGESIEDWKVRIKRENEIDHQFGISPQQRRDRAESERFQNLTFWEKFEERPIEMLKQIGIGIKMVFVLILLVASCFTD